MACNDRRYDKMIGVQRLSGTADAHGVIDNTDNSNWQPYVSSYAAVMTKGGREFWKVDRVEADVSHVWMCPFTPSLAAATPDMRILHEGKYYQIVSVIDVDLAHEEIEIQTKIPV